MVNLLTPVELFTYHPLVALFETAQIFPEHDAAHRQLDACHSVPLSDELRRAEAISGAICRLSPTYLREMWLTFLTRCPTVSVCIPVVQLSARKVMLGLLLILIVIVFPFLSILVSSPLRRGGSELYMTPRRIRRIQKNVLYHNDL